MLTIAQAPFYTRSLVPHDDARRHSKRRRLVDVLTNAAAVHLAWLPESHCADENSARPLLRARVLNAEGVVNQRVRAPRTACSSRALSKKKTSYTRCTPKVACESSMQRSDIRASHHKRRELVCTPFFLLIVVARRRNLLHLAFDLKHPTCAAQQSRDHKRRSALQFFS